MTSKGQEKMSQPIARASDEITIGIDISKDRLDVHLHPAGIACQFTNDRKGHAQLIGVVAPYQPTRVVFEATGRYHRALEMALGKAGLPAVKINPLQARRFAEATGKRVKTDPIDAAMLARFGATMRPEVPPAKDETIAMLAELLAARRGLVKDRTAAGNRGKSLTLAMLKRQSEQHRKQINSQIEAIDREWMSVLAANPRLKARLDILLSIPGVGAATAIALLVDMPELGTMDAKQAASLAGLAPVTRQSGTWKGKSFIQGGRASIRHALYMPALVAIRFNHQLKEKYEALRQTGKPAKVAIVAVMRKIVIIANALIRDNRKWTRDIAAGGTKP
jgi:transposase